MTAMAADLFHVGFDSILGRHLVAKAPIAPGQLVVAQEPAAAVLYEEHVPQRCDWCFKTAASGAMLLRCSRSRHARYCSREHQLAAWQAGYRFECHALLAHAPRVPPPTIRLAAKVLWQISNPQHGRPEHCTWQAVQALLSHWDTLEDEKKVTFAQMAVLAREFAVSGLSTATPCSQPEAEAALPSVEEVAHLLARMACNNHTICDDDLRPVGVGLYPLGALLNHSCTPNCMQSFGRGARIEFRALVKIPPGEPLTISYVELAATLQERREELAATYRFDVVCPQPMPAAETPASPNMQVDSQLCSDISGIGAGVEAKLQGGSSIADGNGRSGTRASGEDTGGSTQPCVTTEAIGSRGSGTARLSRAVLRGTLPVAELDFEVSTSAAAATPAAGIYNSRGFPGHLRVYRGAGDQQQLPPWPQNSRDLLLTQLVALGGQATFTTAKQATAAAGGATAEPTPLLGGLQARLVPISAACTSQDGTSSYELDDEGLAGCPGLAAQGAAGGSLVEVDCWGDWATRAVACGALEPGYAAAGAGALHSIDEATEEQDRQHIEGAGPTWLPDLPQRVGLALQLQASAEGQGRKGQHASAMQLLQQALRLVEPSPLPTHNLTGALGAPPSALGAPQPGLGPFHLVRMRLNAALLKAAIEEGNSWLTALTAAEALTPVYQLVYPAVWPNLGLHYAMLAKLELLHDRVHPAAEHARLALSILQYTHNTSGGLGSAGPLVLEQVQMSLHEAEACLKRV